MTGAHTSIATAAAQSVPDDPQGRETPSSSHAQAERPTVEFDRHSGSGIARITLNRPEKLNSFTRRMHEDLREALSAARDDPGVRVIVIAGRGRGFCAGQDLSDLSFEPGRMSDLGELVENCFNPLIRQIKACPKPILGKVHGVAAGAGASLAMACDLTVAARSASFLQAFVNIGLLPDSGGTWFLQRLAGSQRAMALAMLGEKLPAPVAAQWGLIWQCVDDEELDGCVERTAERLAALPSLALKACKYAIQQASSNTLSDQLDLERDAQQFLGHSHDYLEGVNAFLHKRKAQFEGR